MLTFLLVLFALLFIVSLGSYILLQMRIGSLRILDRSFLEYYIAKIDTLPAIIESLENAGVEHNDLSEIRTFHRNAIMFSNTSSYLILNQNNETTRILKTLMRISLPYKELQQSGAFIHAREIFTTTENEMRQLKQNINTAISQYTFIRNIYLLTPFGWIQKPEERHFITR